MSYDQTARERAEIDAAIARPVDDAIVRGTGRGTGGELIAVDFSPESIDRLRRMQPAGHRPTPEEERRAAAKDAALTPEAIRVNRRRALLTKAGVEPPPDPPGVPADVWTPRKAWERVTAAATWRDAARSGPDGGASREAMQALDAWLRSGTQPTVAILGNVGTGKTVAAWWVLACTGGRLLRLGDVGRNARWDALREEAMTTTGTVVLNDVEPAGDDFRLRDALKTFAEIVQARHEEGRRTILTSNQPRQDCEVKGQAIVGLATMFGARFVDRLDGEGLVIAMRGQSLRGRRS